KFEWKVYSHDNPPGLIDHLAQHGFSVGPKEAVVVLDLRDAPAWVNEPPACEVVRVERVGQIPLFRDAAADIFGKDYGVTSRQLEQAIRTGSTQHIAYVAIVDGVA